MISSPPLNICWRWVSRNFRLLWYSWSLTATMPMSSGSHFANVKYGIFDFSLELVRFCLVGSSFISIVVAMTGQVPASPFPELLTLPLPQPSIPDYSLSILVLYDHVSILLLTPFCDLQGMVIILSLCWSYAFRWYQTWFIWHGCSMDRS